MKNTMISLFSSRLSRSHLVAEANVEQVFSRSGQLSEVNLDSDTLTEMVSIMVNKFTYKPSVEDIMDKNYEMFRGKNSSNKVRETVCHLLRLHSLSFIKISW